MSDPNSNDTNTSITLDSLIGMANEILELPQEPESALLKIEKYTELMDSWLQNKGDLALNEDKLLQLDGIHRLVVVRVKEFMDQTTEELSKIKLRGKGIIAYLDVLPKRIGAMRPRKG